MMRKLKQNKFLILSIILMIILIGYSFYSFYSERFSYVPTYYKIKEKCYEGKDKSHEYCNQFYDDEQLELYIKAMDPVEKYKEYDTITLTCIIVEDTIFSCLQFFSPLLIAIAVLGTVHSKFNSGMFLNYLLRMDYKKYLNQIYKTALKTALIMPISLILVFILSSIFSGFNFDISHVDTGLSVYSKFKYSNFLLYGSIVCLTQFLISLLYANIALYCCKKYKNTLVAIIMSYVIFLVVDLFNYLILYVVIVNKIMGFKNLTDYFNITGYWFFNDSSCWVALIVAFVLQFVSFIILFNSYRDKGRVIESYEKQIS